MKTSTSPDYEAGLCSKRKVAKKHGISTVALWRYATDPSFTAYTITSDANLAGGVFAIDVDGDGDMDFLSASVNDDKITWYENLRL